MRTDDKGLRLLIFLSFSWPLSFLAAKEKMNHDQVYSLHFGNGGSILPPLKALSGAQC